MAEKHISPIIAPEGLTQTSANHIANIAKEMYESLESEMASIRLYNRDYTLAVNGNSYRVENESDKALLNALASKLAEVAQLKSLIAYLREGIKACKAAIESGEAEMNIRHHHNEPKRPDKKSVEGFLVEQSAAEQARYFTLEAKAATLGKMVHPDGPLAEARKRYYLVKKNPTAVSGHGQEAEINTFSSGFAEEDVEKVFFQILHEHRKVQAEFNSLKADLEKRAAEQYRAALDEFEQKSSAFEMEKARERLTHEKWANSLRISIPDSLKGIYEKVSEVAAAR